MIEDRLWGLDRVPWCRPGLELHLVESRLIAYDTGERIPTPAALVEAIERMSLRSLFFHVHEARRRTAGQIGRFLAVAGEVRRECVAWWPRLRAIDFYFLNLSQLRQRVPEALLSASTRWTHRDPERPPYEAAGSLRRDRGPPGGGAAAPLGRAAGRQADRPRQLHAHAAAAWPKSSAGWSR